MSTQSEQDLHWDTATLAREKVGEIRESYLILSDCNVTGYYAHQSVDKSDSECPDDGNQNRYAQKTSEQGRNEIPGVPMEGQASDLSKIYNYLYYGYYCPLQAKKIVRFLSMSPNSMAKNQR